MWEFINKEVLKACKIALKGCRLRDNTIVKDVAQEVLIILFSDNRTEELYNEDKERLKGFIYRIVFRQVKEIGQATRIKLIQPLQINFVDIEDYQFKENKTSHLGLNLKDLQKGLNEIDKLWLQTYKDCNCSYSQVARKIKCDRLTVTHRIKEVFKEVKKIQNK